MIARVVAIEAARVMSIKAAGMPMEAPRRMMDLPIVALVDLRRILLMLVHSYRGPSDSSTRRYKEDRCKYSYGVFQCTLLFILGLPHPVTYRGVNRRRLRRGYSWHE